MDIGYAGAFLGGVLTLLSPCSALLLPAFFAYAFSTKTRLVARTGLFYLGLLSTLVPLGIFAGALGSLVTLHRPALIGVSAALVILLGSAQISAIRLPSGLTPTAGAGSSRLSVFALGTVYGVAGVCTGPILGSILTVAAVGSNAVYGGVLLAVFALGMALPLFVLALLWDRLGISGRRWLRPRPLTIGKWSNSWLMIISGVISVGVGVLLLVSDGTAGLGGVLTVQDQFRAESAATEAAAGISDLVVAGVAALVLAIGMALYFKSRRSEPTTPPEKAPGAVKPQSVPETVTNQAGGVPGPGRTKTGMPDDPQ
ncbi:cytochrome c biogenesis CcdA family protein [Arthrobacter sp. AL08]|uniref:cytochrome c biogenesis CcdA family protein n=1 Tax=unclassified Arthrobacter TaxID=235627 RepID=UPI00249A1EAC|nr:MULTISPECIES: cytochrome c biogenesis CcdA family protein [unclassified Arthrobacter]MDI3240867.1 cytochrome c biogenesis CcdA family protein [Arthrobacter sp. AL05]MDI3277157.1 cytochrome c biogenesis CcdA family protein [Arthrobacter sp. AL08]